MSNEIKHLIVDYFFNLCEEDASKEVKKAINEDSECSRLYNGLNNTVGMLKTMPQEKCPDEVLARMLDKVREKTTSQKNLEGLLKSEFESKSRRNYAFLGKLSRIAAVLAIVVGIAATYMPVVKKMRFMALNNVCQGNLANIGSAISTYATDNAGMLPSVATSNSSSWWKVGSQQDTDHSNTRNVWLLVRDGYSDVNDFACPARPIISDKRLKTVNVCDYKRDFPSKDFVNYSFRIIDGTPTRIDNMGKIILAADSNPLFEENCMDKYTFFKSFELNDQMRSASSINHSGGGQNLMFTDNSVSFSRDRSHGGDDIYTVKDTHSYNGSERPTEESDVFLAP